MGRCHASDLRCHRCMDWILPLLGLPDGSTGVVEQVGSFFLAGARFSSARRGAPDQTVFALLDAIDNVGLRIVGGFIHGLGELRALCLSKKSSPGRAFAASATPRA